MKNLPANQPLPEIFADGEKPSDVKAGPLSAEAMKAAETLGATFSPTDLLARTDGNVGQWLLQWLNKKWIEHAGAGQYRKTDKFGKL
jgi:hypothetical protein